MQLERAKYLRLLEDSRQGLVGFTVAKEEVTEKEISGKSKLEAYQIIREIEHNYRQYNLQASCVFIEWISKNLWTEGEGMMSYDFDLTGPDDQEYEHVARIDYNTRTGGLCSAQNLSGTNTSD